MLIVLPSDRFEPLWLPATLREALAACKAKPALCVAAALMWANEVQEVGSHHLNSRWQTKAAIPKMSSKPALLPRVPTVLKSTHDGGSQRPAARLRLSERNCWTASSGRKGPVSLKAAMPCILLAGERRCVMPRQASPWPPGKLSSSMGNSAKQLAVLVVCQASHSPWPD
ncbi:MAG: hypothetical protein FRX49_02390 [Trebouxia sp. A1-2]|nr:MAG: hypothetical protein FRX49_02390 [Trebouxia sp. A1-2]